MNQESQKSLNQFYNMIGNHRCNAGEPDYERFEIKKQLLEKIAEVENSALSVFDTSKMHYLLSCSKFDKTIGYQLNHNYKVGPEFFYTLMHPDDFPFVIETITKSFLFLNDLPPNEKTNYKLIVDYRLKNLSGGYMRFIQQVVVLELDSDGNIWLILKLFDLVSENVGNEPSQRKLVNLKDGKQFLFNDEAEKKISNRLLTKREIEILGLISQGLDSKNISDRLFISVNTVNNHRQNILSKTKSGNISQALLYAKRIGIL